MLRAVKAVRSRYNPQGYDRLSGDIAQMARAAALQAVGQGFESPYLQNRNGCRKGWGFEGRAAHREYDEKRAGMHASASGPAWSEVP